MIRISAHPIAERICAATATICDESNPLSRSAVVKRSMPSA
jgi:hypothetical protein